ncbi:MAG: DEAD/DEAH box helicase [Chlorobium sp.]|jgi:ATP-dependent RNA helicase DeaD|uniref:DEAD/DEAH box helicase n=1 Tax=Chlorobium sp. TaxID=1095 RepID=UPI0025C1147F|nr:DEAD/DEAH box helicase [Chlorobium sp.]MCF8216739.1 DEAD/DEAH box helicase [Chlorobium sp.]MCF8271586.1 DEAD/DEAH box helicase [Chlorobium sp.]MCF8287979.1 DEAD/DEAH box helicase [Chlorobium sp.]MCF8291503.1 DEAD/DEAH box helicase [Chlorobium sp.]MCF8385637.1 DEAD/DEAH box helicase [Chlorobium sp.]
MIEGNVPVSLFSELQLAEPLLRALEAVGYEKPTPIQAQTIPLLLEGRDVLGQAQTGTGKTAAFALPVLSNIVLGKTEPQALVLTPTRELAIQVAEAFHRYAEYLKGFHVAPIYGGQDYGTQLRMLKRGVHVVVGTPGRVMDHMRRGSLSLDGLQCLVLDEADEMLRMGFIDDVEWILDQTPENRQVALFSATMPAPIRRIAQKHLNSPAEITIQAKTTTVDTIRQRYWIVGGSHKLDVLTRILEVEQFEGMLIFVRTKTMTLELAEKLQARGYAASALNGDMVQNQRERTVDQLKDGTLNIVIATDVAARGLDVERISHVINYDIPSDTESYVHRIGRTGRAGRSGEAILFVSPREKNMLYAIEKATRKRIDLMELPSTEIINDKRISKFKQRITDTIAAEDLDFYTRLIEQYCHEHDVSELEAAAALASLFQGETPLLLSAKPERTSRPEGRDRFEGRDHSDRDRGSSRKPRSGGMYADEGKESYRVEVGNEHGVKAGNILGAIINEIGLDPESIGRITINDTFSTVELPSGMPNDVFQEMRKVRVCGRQLRLSKMEERQQYSSGSVRKSKPKSGFRNEESFFTGHKKKRK